MITYDSHSWRTFASYHGSVFPAACKYALLPCILAFTLKILDNEGILEISTWKLLEQPATWSAFTGTVGFLLVFRTGQCYSRFVSSAACVFSMRAQMRESLAGLTAFCTMSKASKKDQYEFQDKLIHLFSTFDACALASVSGSSHNHFNILDVEHMPSIFIEALKDVTAEHRVELTYQWINNLVIGEIATGLLNVPPPILSRVFQCMEKAMVEYNALLQLMTIPFPFPYSQACFILMSVHAMISPLIVVGWTAQPVSAGLVTFLSTLCFLSLEMISAELENPFGDDENDLPVTSIHDDFNTSLQLLMHPTLQENFWLQRHRARDLFTSGRTSSIFKEGCAVEDYKSAGMFDLEMGKVESEHFSADCDTEESAGRDNGGQTSTKAAGTKSEQQQAVEKERPPGAETSAPQAPQGKFAAAAGPSQPPDLTNQMAAQMTASSVQLTSSTLLELPWMSHFQQRQSKFQEDILRRLDEIIKEMKKPGWECPRQGALERPDSSRRASLEAKILEYGNLPTDVPDRPDSARPSLPASAGSKIAQEDRWTSISL